MNNKIEISYKDIIPKLKAQEYEGLENSILKEGVRDALLVWNEILIDGHNRLEICEKHNIEYETKQIQFDNEKEAKIWIIENQLSRRNLNDWQIFQLKKGKREILTEKYEKERVNLRVSKDDTREPESGRTRNEIVKELGWSTGKFAQADIVDKKATPETKQRLENNDISIHKAYKEIKKAEKKAERQRKINEQKKAIENGEIESPDGLFDIIVIDPPWEYGDKYDPETRRGTVTYPTMKLEDIYNLEIPAADDCILWLWTTHKYLRDAFDILKKWGFDYKATLVWNKDKMGIGRKLRMQCEFCLLGIKGKPLWDATDIRDIITEKRREHSRKPEKFYNMIDDKFVGKKLDYFSREVREGWQGYGTKEF